MNNNYYQDQLKQIREMGYRVTPQREIILEALVRHGGHATALEVYDRVAQQAPSINKATIYRVLEFFCDVQLASKSEIGGQVLYEVVAEEPHHHLLCTECGSVYILSNKHFDGLVEHLAAEHGFQADLNHIVISGLCQYCQP